MDVTGVIPARFASIRFPGKPLALINGQPMLKWVVDAAKKSKRLTRLIVATDHDQIFQLARSLNIDAIMTDPNLPSGSDRAWAATANLKTDVIINIQGDEPLLDPQALDLLASAFEDPNVDMATLGKPMTEEALHAMTTAKIVLNRRDEAIYFSRFAIPYSRDKDVTLGASLKHIGIYGYKKSFLEEFVKCGPVPIELAEGLEQLRALYLGARIKVLKTHYDSWGVDTPEDVVRVEKLLSAAEK